MAWPSCVTAVGPHHKPGSARPQRALSTGHTVSSSRMGRRRWCTVTRMLWGRGMKQSQLRGVDAKGRTNSLEASQGRQSRGGLLPSAPHARQRQGAINMSSLQTPTCVPSVTRRGVVTAQNAFSKSSHRGRWDLIRTHTAGLRRNLPRGAGPSLTPEERPRPPTPATRSPAPRSARV